MPFPTRSRTPCARSRRPISPETARLIAKGTPVARANTGIDGGMNKVFAARVPDGNTGLSEGGDGQGLSLLALSPRAGHHPLHVNPPKAPVRQSADGCAGAAEACRQAPAPAPAPAAPPTRVANAAPAAENDGFFSNLARKVGLGGPADATASTTAFETEGDRGQARLARAEECRAQGEPKIEPKAEPKQAVGRPPLKPSVTDTPATKDNHVAGSAPILPPNSFDQPLRGDEVSTHELHDEAKQNAPPQSGGFCFWKP